MTVIKTEEIYKGNILFLNCILDLLIEKKTYHDNQEFYYLSYIWNLENNDVKNHPFFNDSEFMENHIDGEIIVKNSLSDKFIEFLTMNEDDLNNFSGNTIVADYKLKIIKSISLFWD